MSDPTLFLDASTAVAFIAFLWWRLGRIERRLEEIERRLEEIERWQAVADYRLQRLNGGGRRGG